MLLLLSQLLLTISVAAGMHVSLTPPSPPPSKEHRKSSDDISLVYRSSELITYSCWIHAAVESFLIVTYIIQQFTESTTLPPALASILGPYLTALQTAQPITTPPVRLIGGALVLAGGLVRWLCYRELGRHFTFRVAILSDHSLVTTGPYGVVRHPSYTGCALMVIGSVLWHGAPGAWLRESGTYQKRWALVLLVPTTLFYAFVMVMLVMRRPIKEDALLRKEFGEKWDEWAKTVPCRLVPGVY